MNKKYITMKIDEILFKEWDPIGINHSGPIDEYSGYVPLIYKKLISGANKKGISDALLKLEVSSMGLNGDYERCDKIASKILALI